MIDFINTLDEYSTYDKIIEYLENNIINVNEIINDDLRLFDYCLTFGYINIARVEPDTFSYMLILFLKKDYLIIKHSNLLLLDIYFRSLFLKEEIYHEYDAYKLLVNNKTAKKLDYFPTMLYHHASCAIKSGFPIKFKYLLSLPEYDMKKTKNKSLFDIAIMYSRNKINNIESTINIIKEIISHDTFEFSEIDTLSKLSCDDRIKEMIHQQFTILAPSKLFLLMVGYSDGYFVKNDSRFFNIISTLPIELQMILANRVFRNRRDFISSDQINKAIRILK